MRNLIIGFFIFIVCLLVHAHAATLANTKRISQLTNERVRVWKTIIYPSKDKILPMHHHQRDRVVVALDAGTLKIVNDQGKVHYLSLKKNQAYFLPKDKQGEKHSDENISHHVINVMVIELN